ncbi:MAG: alpha/beta hydrolase family protein [Oscillospiraceae bacterium]|nr:alpha/beta hydrolase family protein [Oscillospiraceae bacterium]
MSQKFYTSREHLLKIMKDNSRKLALKTGSVHEYQQWKEDSRAKIRELLGLCVMQPAPLNPQTIETVRKDGYTRVKMTIDTEPDVTMPFYVLIPDGLKTDEKRPAILAPHGHGSFGKDAVANNPAFPELEGNIKALDYGYGEAAAKAGFVTFCPDARGFGERREKYNQADTPDQKLASSCAYLNTMAMGVGTNVAGMWTWDLMRLIDYAQSRSDVQKDKIGCIGLSGGGLQTLWLTALDERVKCAVISGYFYGFGESIQDMMNCACNYIPHMWEYCDVGDVGALIAPRPLLIETGTLDVLNGESNLGNVIPYVEQVRGAYDLLGAPENIYHDIFEGPHKWNGVYSIPWIVGHLLEEKK